MDTTILIVEDDDTLRPTLGRWAIKHDLMPLEATSAEEALTLFDDGDASQFLRLIGDFEDYLEHNVDAQDIEALGPLVASRIGASALAIRTYLQDLEAEESAEIRMLFLVVCLWCIGDAIGDAR